MHKQACQDTGGAYDEERMVAFAMVLHCLCVKGMSAAQQHDQGTSTLAHEECACLHMGRQSYEVASVAADVTVQVVCHERGQLVQLQCAEILSVTQEQVLSCPSVVLT